jgi:hypothetical protein
MSVFMVLETADAVIKALGDNAGVRELTGARSSRVSNWRASGRFPSDMFEVMTVALARLGHSAPSSLWGQREAVAADSEEVRP